MGTIYGNGMNQGDLVTFLKLINTNLTGVLAKLDDDTGVSATDYESSLAITFPSTITTCGIRSQGDVLDFLEDWITNFNAMLTKIDSDAGAGIDNNYNSTLAITDIINPTNNPAKGLYNNGVDQGDLVDLLQTIITNFNACLTKMDTDPLGDSDYSATWAISDTVDDTAC